MKQGLRDEEERRRHRDLGRARPVADDGESREHGERDDYRRLADARLSEEEQGRGEHGDGREEDELAGRERSGARPARDYRAEKADGHRQEKPLRHHQRMRQARPGERPAATERQPGQDPGGGDGQPERKEEPERLTTHAGQPLPGRFVDDHPRPRGRCHAAWGYKTYAAGLGEGIEP